MSFPEHPVRTAIFFRGKLRYYDRDYWESACGRRSFLRGLARHLDGKKEFRKEMYRKNPYIFSNLIDLVEYRVLIPNDSVTISPDVLVMFAPCGDTSLEVESSFKAAITRAEFATAKKVFVFNRFSEFVQDVARRTCSTPTKPATIALARKQAAAVTREYMAFAIPGIHLPPKCIIVDNLNDETFLPRYLNEILVKPFHENSKSYYDEITWIVRAIWPAAKLLLLVMYKRIDQPEECLLAKLPRELIKMIILFL